MNRNKTVGIFAILLVFALSAFAQEKRSEVSVEGTGFFTRETNNSFLNYQATDTGGFVAGYRRHINKWLAVDANYGWSRNTQQYFGSQGFATIRSNVHQVTGDAALKVPVHFGKLRPYVMGGGGALIFKPTDTAGVPAIDTQVRPAFLYGGGTDYDLSHHLALRAAYRGFVYKAPDFDRSALNVDKLTHTAQPSLGFVYRF